MLPLKPSSLSVEEQKTILRNTAIRYLSFRPRFKAEVFTRLGQKATEMNLPDSFTLINQIVETLEKSGFINDQNLLESYILSHLRDKLKGPYWLRPRLIHFGINRNEVDAALRRYAGKEAQLEVIRKFMAKKHISRVLDQKSKARLYRALCAEVLGPI